MDIPVEGWNFQARDLGEDQEEIYGCSEREHEVSCYERKGCR